MRVKRIAANIVSVVGLFFAFILPVGHLVFSDTGANFTVRVTSWLGIYRDAEPGDSIVDMSLLLSLCLAILVVCLANFLINWQNRKHSNVK